MNYTNSILNRKVEELAKDNSLLNRKVEELAKDNSKLNQQLKELKIDINNEKKTSYKLNSELIKIKNKLNSISEHLLCPISQEIMNDPVIAPSGNTYDEKQLKVWLTNHKTEPLTNKEITVKELTKNRVLEDIIKEFKK